MQLELPRSSCLVNRSYKHLVLAPIYRLVKVEELQKLGVAALPDQLAVTKVDLVWRQGCRSSVVIARAFLLFDQSELMLHLFKLMSGFVAFRATSETLPCSQMILVIVLFQYICMEVQIHDRVLITVVLL